MQLKGIKGVINSLKQLIPCSGTPEKAFRHP
jgi:hypothetical protein